MKRSTNKQLIIAMLAGVLTSPVMADTATDINAANELLREGKLDQAIDRYRAVTPSDSVKDELDYNLAVAQYRKGDIKAAQELFTESCSSSNAALASAARYNLGNCFYTEAVATADKDKAAAIQFLDQAIDHYRGSLEANPTQVDARANIELAVELRNKLRQSQQDQQQQDQQQQDQQQQDQQQQDQQQQDQQQQDQQQQDQQQQDQQQQDQQQQDQQQQDQQQQDQQQQDQQQQDQQQQDQQQQDQQQQDQQQQDQQQQDQQQQDQQSQGSQSKETQSQGQSADQEQSEAESQQSSEDKPSSNQQSEAEQSAPQVQAGEPEEEQPAEANDQQVPSGQLKAATEQEAGDKPRGAVASADAKPELMSKEEALKMLQSVRDRDMLRRLRQEQIEKSRHISTERDW
jgi:Ca-activated chloride channel family protein